MHFFSLKSELVEAVRSILALHTFFTGAWLIFQTILMKGSADWELI